MRYSRTAAPASLIGLILALSVVLAILATAGLPSRVGAQTWPTNWILIDTDPNEPGQANYRDVVAAYYNYDAGHLYLRLQTVDTPTFSGANGPARFKWFIDVGLGSNIHRSGGNILGTDYLLFVEDSDNNGTGDVYLLPANGNDTFSQYEPWNTTNESPITAPDASYRITGNYIDVWISFGLLPPATSPTHMSLAWATDQKDPGLESAPNLDTVDTADTPIHLDADLAVTKDVNNHTPSVGSSVTYTVVVTNSGPAAATNIVITDLLPSGVTYQSYTATQGTYNSGNGQWSVGNLADGASATLTITASVTGTGTITNTAAITAVVQPDPDPADNSDSASIYVQSPLEGPDLIVAKDVNDHFPYVGDPVTFTIEVTNTGPAAATNVEVTDLLPSGVTYQSHSVSQGSYSSGTGIWSIGTLADGATATLTVAALVTAPGTINNTADITDLDQTDPDLEDNSDTAELFAAYRDADLYVVKDVDDHTPSVGSSVTYTVVVTNSGPAAATNIVITDLLPSGVTYQSYTATQGTYNSGNGQWSVGDLADGASATLTITALVTGTGTITNTAAITAVVQPDPDPADNSDSADIYVQSSPPDEADLIVVKDVDDHFPYVGDPVTFTIEVTNTGPAAATNVEVTDLLPSGVTYQSHSVSQGSYSSGTGIWSIGTLADGATATLTVAALVTAPGTINNTADITDLDQTDPDLEDNSDTAELLATQRPVYPPGPPRGVAAFPGMFIGIGAALGAGALAYFVRRRILGNE